LHLTGQSAINRQLSKQEIYDILIGAISGFRSDALPPALYRKLNREFQISKS